MQGGFRRRAWWCQGLVGLLVGRPSFAAFACTALGTGVFHSRSPIRWSSQMLSEKKSMPGLRPVFAPLGCVRASRWERRNMFDFPTVQGAIATVDMAV